MAGGEFYFILKRAFMLNRLLNTIIAHQSRLTAIALFLLDQGALVIISSPLHPSVANFTLSYSLLIVAR
jgi:hypothetical protein